MFNTDEDYYRRRATEEREMALRTERRDVAEIHEELARQYDALVEQKGLRSHLTLLQGHRMSA
jgi:predicted glycoside hydrolase/deacetylase ChbG (UPF0249 family)